MTPHRIFKDRGGKVWNVWQVHPSAAERRFSQRRVHDEDRTDSIERRSGRDRRESENPIPPEPKRHATVAAEFTYGWLCFETAGEKRRLAPVPEGWERRRRDDRAVVLRGEAGHPPAFRLDPRNGRRREARLADVDAEADGASVAIGGPRGQKSQTQPVGRRQSPEDSVVAVTGGAGALREVGTLCVHRVGKRIVEKELRGEFVGSGRSGVGRSLKWM